MNELLTSSIETYRTLRDRIRMLSTQLGLLSAKESVAAYGDLLDLQRACRSIDEKLVPLLIQDNPNRDLTPRVWERMQLIAEVIEENSRIMPMLLSRKAVLAAELNQSREGQGALFGYRSNGSVSGRLLSRSC